MKNFNQSKREDLQGIERMQANGFTVEFNNIDIKYNRVTPENPPNMAVSFVRGDFHVWSIREGWQTAILSGDGSSKSLQYRDHKPVKTLKEIV